MREKLTSLIPFFYFVRTRLDRKALIFHSVYEWIPAFLVLLYCNDYAFLTSLRQVSLYYLAFISIYELGYFINDWQSLKELSGRRRFDFNSGPVWTIFFFAIRGATFFICSWKLGVLTNSAWWMWYLVLAIVFMVHNILKQPSLKILTFIQLAFIRFFSPFVFELSPSSALALVNPVFINYVLFRLLTYMESKDILVLKDRKTNVFRIGYYALSLGFSALLYILTDSVVPFIVSGYYLAASTLFAIFEQVLRQNDQK